MPKRESGNEHACDQNAGVLLLTIPVFATNGIDAVPPHSTLSVPAGITLQAGMIDRSRKANRLNLTEPDSKPALPVGCDSPFSSLTKISPPSAGRCPDLNPPSFRPATHGSHAAEPGPVCGTRERALD
jgi:hypothetical protein